MRSNLRLEVRRSRGLMLVLSAITALFVLAPAQPAHAGTDGRKTTTIALGAATVLELLNHQYTAAALLGAGTAYAYKQYDDARKAENNNKYYYDSRYPNGYDPNGHPYNGSYNNGGYNTHPTNQQPYGGPSRNTDPSYHNGQGNRQDDPNQDYERFPGANPNSPSPNFPATQQNLAH